MFWGCFAASGTECLESVQGIMKSQDYQGSSLQVMAFQQDDDPKQTREAKSKTLDNSAVALYEPRAKSFWTSVEGAETYLEIWDSW